MRKVGFVIGIIVLLVALIPVSDNLPAQAAEPPVPQETPASVPPAGTVGFLAHVPGQPGNSAVTIGLGDFDMNVTLDNRHGLSLYGAVAAMDFDASLLNVTGITNGTDWSVYLTATWDNSSGWAVSEAGIGFPIVPLTTNTTQCVVHFQSTGVEGSTMVNFTTGVGWGYDTKVANSTGDDVLCWTAVQNFSVTIVGIPQLTVNVTPNGTGTVKANGVTLIGYPNTTNWSFGENMTLEAVPAMGWWFDHWSGNLSGNTTPVNITMDSDKNMTAHFTPIYNLTVTSDGCCPINVSGAVNGTVLGGGNQTFVGIVEGENVTVSVDDSAVCCEFDSWSDAGEKAHNITMDSDKSVTAYCSVLSYNLTVNVTPVGGGNVTVNGVTPPSYPNSTTWVCGDNVTVAAVAASGYSFDHWSGNLSGNTTPTNMTMYDNYSIVANFAEVTATLEGHVSFTERGSAPCGTWIEPFVVRFFQDGNETPWSPMNATTDDAGVFIIPGIVPGTYDISIKNWTCLSELVSNVTLNNGNTPVVDFGTTREGDCYHLSGGEDWVDFDDYINTLVNYNSVYWQADFDRDGIVDFDDYIIVFVNYHQEGDLWGK